MGVVWKAKLVGTERLVALKQVLADEFSSPEVLERFKLEARAAAGLDHAGIVPVYDIGEAAGRPYYTMPLVGGGSLKTLLVDGPLRPRTAALYLRQLAEAVQHAHDRGVIHRDLKPENILLQPLALSDTGEAGGDSLPAMAGAEAATRFTPRLTDFGLARAVDANRGGLTHTGMQLGTPPFMAPEQASGDLDRVGRLSDVYGLGAVLYSCLTGRPPFQAATIMETLRQVREQDPVPVRRLNPAVPRDLETVCLKCLEKEPTRRYPSAGALMEDLRRFVDDEPVLAVPAGWPTRAAKWIKRRPAVSGLLAALILVAVTALAVIAVTVSEVIREADLLRREKDRADAQAAAALSQTARADDEAARAVRHAEEVARALYIGQIGWTRAEILENGHAAAVRVLEQTRPDLRSWEYGHLLRRAEGTPLVLRMNAGAVYAVAFSPDGSRMATALADHKVRLWDVRTGQEVLVLRGHGDKVSSVAYSPDGTRLASAAYDATAGVWDAESGTRLLTLRGHSRAVNCVAYSPEGDRVATGSEDQSVRVWDARTGAPCFEFSGRGSAVNAVAYSPDDTTLVAACDDGTVLVRDAATGKECPGFQERGSVAACAFSPDGRQIALAFNRRDFRSSLPGTDDGSGVDLRDVRSGQTLRLLKTRAGRLQSLAYSPDGATLAVTSSRGAIQLWDPRAESLPISLPGQLGPVSSVAFSPDGARMATGARDDTARLWDPRAESDGVEFSGHRGAVLTFVVSPDGKLAVTTSNDGTARVWDVQSATALVTLRHGGIIMTASFSPDGRLLATGSRDGVVRVADVPTGAEIHALRGHGGGVMWVAFSPDGLSLASASEDKTARTWDTRSWKELRVFRGHTNPVSAVAFTPDGNRLVTASADQTARAWDARNGEPLLVFRGHTQTIDSIAVSPDGKLLGTASWDQTARLWDLGTGAELRRLVGHTNIVTDVSFSPDGRRVVTGSWDQTARVWDVLTAQELLALRGHADHVSSALFSPDGAYVATASWDKTAKLWDSRTTGESTLTKDAGPKDIISSTRAGRPPGGGDYNLWAEDWHRRQARAVTWHAAEAARAEQRGDPFARAFHLKYLLASNPTDPELYRCRATALEASGRPFPAALHRTAALLIDQIRIIYYVTGHRATGS
jgi:WD40 repeat protein